MMQDMTDQPLLLHNMILHTRVLGPGVRAAVWFQGCQRSCEGCMSPSSRDLNGGRRVSVAQVCGMILAQKDIEGVTISGGEPFLQPEALYGLLRTLRQKSGLGIIIYTGYRMEELAGMQNPLIDEITRSLADLIIDGAYIDSLNDGRSLIGSSNQRLCFITDRYRPFRALYQSGERNVEIRISGKEATLIGIPDKKTLRSWLETADKL